MTQRSNRVTSSAIHRGEGHSPNDRNGCDRRLIADFRRGVTCLVYTQFSLRTGQFFPVFSAFERLDLGAI